MPTPLPMRTEFLQTNCKSFTDTLPLKISSHFVQYPSSMFTGSSSLNVHLVCNRFKWTLMLLPSDYFWINPVTGGMYITDPMFPRGYWATGIAGTLCSKSLLIYVDPFLSDRTGCILDLITVTTVL